jgi:hypothetical protein
MRSIMVPLELTVRLRIDDWNFELLMSSEICADCGPDDYSVVAPLLLARNAISITIHFYARTI